MTRALPADILLRKNLELILLQHAHRHLGVVDMEGEGRLAARAGEEGVAEVDIALRLEESAKEAAEILGAAGQLDHHQGGLGMGDGMLQEDAARPARIVDHQPDDGGVGAVEDRQGDDMDMALAEQLHQVEEPPRLVLHEDRELDDLMIPQTFFCF